MLQPQVIIDSVGTGWTPLDAIVSRVASIETSELPGDATGPAASQAVRTALTRSKVQLTLNAAVMRGELERRGNREYRQL